MPAYTRQSFSTIVKKNNGSFSFSFFSFLPLLAAPSAYSRVASCCENKLKRNRYRSLSRHSRCIGSQSETRSQGPTRKESRLHFVLALTELALNKVSTLKARRWISGVKLSRTLSECVTQYPRALLASRSETMFTRFYVLSLRMNGRNKCNR